jgi:hypothetical protein
MAEHKVEAATAETEAKANVSAVVRRFTGRYECGCQVDDLNVPQPTECVEHEQPAIYNLEPITMNHIEVGPGFAEYMEGV